jgi:GNAT superfamily N-acetyltransferase
MHTLAPPVHSGPYRLSDGRSIWLRLLNRDDGPNLMELYQRLSHETIRRRFFQVRPTCDPSMARELAAVDQIRKVAFAAVPDPSDSNTIVAVGRIHSDGAERAELGLLVEDRYQGLGLGRILLERLLREARRRRLRVLAGHVLYGNTPILRLLRSIGQPLEVGWHGGDVLDFELTVADGPEQGRADAAAAAEWRPARSA